MTLPKLKTDYYKPTPVKWRKLGDTLLIVGLLLTTYNIAEDIDKWIQVGALIFTIAGKFLTNFFTEE